MTDCGCIRSASELQGTRGRQGLKRSPELHRRTGRAHPKITAHRATIQLPKGAKTMTAQKRMTPPERYRKPFTIHRMTFEPTAHGKAAKR